MWEGEEEFGGQGCCLGREVACGKSWREEIACPVGGAERSVCS